MSEKKQQHKATENDKKARAAFRDLETARATKPDNPRYKLFEIHSPTGEVYYTYTDGPNWSIVQVAKQLGWTAALVDAKPVTKEAVGSMLSRLSEADRAALLANYLPQQPPKKGK